MTPVVEILRPDRSLLIAGVSNPQSFSEYAANMPTNSEVLLGSGLHRLLRQFAHLGSAGGRQRGEGADGGCGRHGLGRARFVGSEAPGRTGRAGRRLPRGGIEWREPGCGLCVAVNGEVVAPGERVVSTSNRNFVGRQGPGARTHLASPAMAVAAAVTGEIFDVRKL